MGSQTAVFRHLVRDRMRRAPVTVPPQESCAATADKMARAAVSSAVVVAPDGQPVGIVTEQDVARRLAFRVPADTPVERVMSAPVLTVRADDHLYHAIAVMRRRGLRHLPVVDADRRVTGLLDLGDALSVAAASTLRLIDALTHEETLDGLKEVKAAQVEAAAALSRDNQPAADIQQLITDVNLDIHRRVVGLSQADMEADGWGAPPVPFAVIVMGSGGRGENYLVPDQDNGFILADYPDADHLRVDPYFIELAERMTRALDAVGFPLCDGNVMATNPVWRKTLSQWQEQVAIWGRRSDGVSILFADIFFDFRPACGAAALAAELRRAATAMARRNRGFLRRLAGETAEGGGAVGLFGRFRTERDEAAVEGRINLKLTAVRPLIEAARLYALREGVAATSTLDRLAALRAADVVSGDEHEDLAGAYQVVARLLLRQQIRDFKAGRPVGNHVTPDALSERDRRLLRAALRSIRAFARRARADLTGEVL